MGFMAREGLYVFYVFDQSLISTAAVADVAEPVVVGVSTWRSETFRQLEEETAAGAGTSLTVEPDEVDRRHQPAGSSSWQQKVRRRINDMSPFSRTNHQGTQRHFYVPDIFQSSNAYA